MAAREHIRGARLTQQIVRELLDYDPVSGLLRWRKRDRKWFKTDHSWKKWNTRYAGQIAGGPTEDGYLMLHIFKTQYRAHRVIFFYITGRWPLPEVDHDNRNSTDNRWENLSESTEQQNQRNKKLYKNNTTGHVGVYWCEREGRWYARIVVWRRNLHIGIFDTFEDACAAREAAERKYGFHKNHGT